MEEFFSPQTLADFLEVPIATVYRWRNHGDGPPGFRAGRHVRYRRRDVDAWIEQLARDDRRATA
jgi:excisionase family DNA binding protein